MMRDTLLVIDDSELDLAILNEIFKQLFRVECVSDAHRGLAFLKENRERICAVLLDICLGRRGAGFTVLHQLQVDEATAALPVILITTDANEKDVRDSVARGAVDFLVKPVDPRTVQERVCAVVRGAWPPESTILDRPAEPRTQEGDAAPGGSLFQEVNLAQMTALSRAWLRKLEAFCAFRPVLDLNSCREMGAITALLAGAYAEQHPDGPLSDSDAALIGLAAPFYDIGLLGLPDRLAAGEEGLTGSDADDYARHTNLGYDLFSTQEDVPFFRYAAQIALWHHKNADGSGWPREGGGDIIPLSARLARAALRMQHYLHFYQGYEDAVERSVRALGGEVGTILTEDVYQALAGSCQELRAVLRQGAE